MDPEFRNKVIFCLYFLLLVAVSLVVFYPSFEHTFRSDQIVYFANTREYKDVISLWQNDYAYEHVRYYYPGDAFLFRPLFFILLGFEKGVFNMHYAYWHILGFVLHMLTVWFLFRILYELKAGIFAFLCSLFYACCLANVEIVIWEHINGYVLFNALMLGSFFYFKKSFDDGKYHKNLNCTLVFLMICTFLHEWGFIFAAMFGVCFYFKNIEAGRLQDNKKIWLFFLPGFSYVLAYWWVNQHFQTGGLSKIQAGQFLKIMQFSNLWHAINLIPRFFCYLMFGGLFPSELEGRLNNMDRLVFIHRTMFTADFVLNATAFCSVVFLIFQGFSRAVTARNKPYLLLLAGMIVTLLISLPLMRLPTHGEQYVFQTGSYYSYLFWGYFLVIIFMVVDWSKINLQGRAGLKYLAVASLIALIFLNAYQTRKLNQSIKTSRYAWKQYIDKLNGFIAVHGKEQGFSFFINNDIPIMLSHKIKGSMKDQTDRLDLGSILYYPYYNPQNPKYIFFLRDGSIK